MRMSPDGRMVQAPSGDTIPWPRQRKRKPKAEPMVAQQQQPAPFQHNLSPQDQAKQAQTKATIQDKRSGKSSLRANAGGAPLNPSLAASGVKQTNNLTN